MIITQKPLFLPRSGNALLSTQLLREKCPNTEFFSGPHFAVFGLNTEIYCISPYSVRIQENTDQKKLRYLETFHAVLESYSESFASFRKISVWLSSTFMFRTSDSTAWESKASVHKFSTKWLFRQVSQNSEKYTCLGDCRFLSLSKKTPAQVFSCLFCENFHITIFTKQLQWTPKILCHFSQNNLNSDF